MAYYIITSKGVVKFDVDLETHKIINESEPYLDQLYLPLYDEHSASHVYVINDKLFLEIGKADMRGPEYAIFNLDDKHALAPEGYLGVIDPFHDN